MLCAASQSASELPVDAKAPHPQIGQLMPEDEFLSGAVGEARLLSGKTCCR